MKSQPIYDALKKRVVEGVYPEGTRFPSEDTLLTEFRVSKVTINKIVSKLAAEGLLVRGIRGAGTRVAEKIFRPHGTIAFVGKLNEYSVEILRGVQKECLHNDMFPIVFSPEAEELPYCLSMLNKKTVLGIVTIGYGILKADENMPLICLDYTLPHSMTSSNRVHFIGSNNYSGGKDLIHEVLRRGHREIAIYSSERFVFRDAPVTPRIMGFHHALEEAGYTDFVERTFYGMPGSAADAKMYLTEILKKYPKTSVICADSDYSADLIHHAAKAMNISCPGDIALTGFGNVTHLGIATVNQHPDRQGQLAVRHILAWNNGKKLPGEDELVDTELSGIEHIPILL